MQEVTDVSLHLVLSEILVDTFIRIVAVEAVLVPAVDYRLGG